MPDNINLDRIGGTQQSGANVIDPGTSSVKVKIVSGGGGAVTVADGADVAQGSTGDAAWSSGAGTVVALLKKIASAGGSAVSVADGSDVAEGSTTDAAVVSDSSGTVSGKLRGLVKMFADVWDSVNHRFNVALQNAIPAGTNLIGKVSTDQSAHGTSDLVAADIIKVGGAAIALGQAASATSFPVVIASDQSPIAAMVRSLPLLNYFSIPIADNLGAVWSLTANNDGTFTVTPLASGIAVPLILNDLASMTSYQITVNGGNWVAAPVTFSPRYPSAVGFITSTSAKTALFISAGQLTALHPTSAPDFNVALTALPPNAAQENGNLALMVGLLRGQDRTADLLERMLARLDSLALMWADAGLKYVDSDEVITTIH